MGDARDRSVGTGGRRPEGGPGGAVPEGPRGERLSSSSTGPPAVTPANTTRSLEFSIDDKFDHRAYPVLLVDDEPENLQAFRLNFRDDFTIDTAESGQEALELMRSREYAVLVSDHRMPGMSGAEVLEKSVSVQPNVIRIIVTGYTDTESLISAINQGRIYHFVTKPWDRDELSLTLKRAIETYALAAHNRRLIADLRRRTAELQRMVAARTRALREANERLMKLAISDGLTGLYNHRYFQERWRREVARARRYDEPVSLMVLDVDKFKNYNDTMGHPQGDILLKEIAGMLVRSVREVDLVARYGGEEFVIVLAKSKKGDATVLAERVRSLVAQHPFPHRDVQPGGRITVSIGVSTYPDDGADAGEVIQAADKALYRAKHEGRDRVMASGGFAADVDSLPEEVHDMDLIVEEDGETRLAVLSATDVPSAPAIDSIRARARSNREEAPPPAPEGTDSGEFVFTTDVEDVSVQVEELVGAAGISPGEMPLPGDLDDYLTPVVLYDPGEFPKRERRKG